MKERYVNIIVMEGVRDIKWMERLPSGEEFLDFNAIVPIDEYLPDIDYDKRRAEWGCESVGLKPTFIDDRSVVFLTKNSFASEIARQLSICHKGLSVKFAAVSEVVFQEERDILTRNGGQISFDEFNRLSVSKQFVEAEFFDGCGFLAGANTYGHHIMEAWILDNLVHTGYAYDLHWKIKC